MQKKFLVFLLLFANLSVFAQPKAEFRAAWVATVKMIDFPSKRGLNSHDLKQELIDIIEMHQSNGINAIIFQVRPAADAFYYSKYEPWSEWLTGRQGRAPNPYFDPLKFMIAECHKRDMQLHAWINPFRAVATIDKADIAYNHITRTKPEWFFNYGINKYFNPGIPEVREYITKIIVDIVDRYDIDGIHFDDYFYPYPKKNTDNTFIEIPDNKQFNKYGLSYTNVQDWRRNNMNLFIEMVSKKIKETKSWVVFGIGPGGIWRNKGYDPKGSNTRGFATYDWLYADILKWLENSWIDYVAPQIYWYIGHKAADYEELVGWWDKNTYGKHLYIGIGAYKIDNTKEHQYWGNPSEVPNQIRLARKYENVKGFVFYKTKTFKDNPLGFADSLRTDLFRTPCSIPLMSYLDSVPPTEPLNVEKMRIKNEFTIMWDKEDFMGKNETDTAIFYVVYRFRGKETIEIGAEDNKYLTTKKTFFSIERDRSIRFFGEKHTFIITSFDRFNNESEPSKPVTILFKKNTN